MYLQLALEKARNLGYLEKDQMATLIGHPFQADALTDT
jgi:hypothetical protein